ncbi:HAMP domain-containing sensor histidine kinase [Clostridium sp. JS66]|uniref:HAMP domain-containing sensor histidine kinase n=1 Tax=Clostridium sp. JS66 TaxID=3064705 RepID=UPI00298E9B33|nr:HAMP domain-containing sensor histidine kinase [Clostridium sp. JS66]WPC42201.1 HAMP domain-containing sensor histidine kinase [Clostridium sp. JS66]
MKRMSKIIMRYVLSAGGIIIILLITNIIVFALCLSSNNSPTTSHRISEISKGLKKEDNNFVLSDKASSIITKEFQWAMLINDTGKVVWSKNLPNDIPLSYTSSDIASFTRWYLKEYPVYTWKHKDGLFVAGGIKNSTWKSQLEIPENIVRNSIKWISLGLLINFIVAMLLAFLFGIRFFLSLRKIIEGVEDMAKKKQVSLGTKGAFGELAHNINITSEELLRQQALIEKRDTARNNWITGVSHDIRTPLSMIMGYSSDLEDNENFSKDDRKKLTIIRLQSEKIKQLVNDLNLTIKLEYEMQPLNIKPFYAAELTRKVVVDHLNNLSNDRYNLEFSISSEAQSCMINGDMRLFERALNNIIGNSMKHNEDGCNIYIELDQKEGNCVIEIKDTGSGFKNDILQTLNFSTEFPTNKSHGLGLYIVKQIIAAHGGKFYFQNWEQGSSTKLCIPSYKK